ncbi:MAG: 5-(carboxyamino)imidazole ribonucleotide synthase [Dehalococcoidia bacterium]|nr:5-(carboxyamino)imidazole ribonucleotide synthase [Dehalococcoidia bacterium]
MLGSGQLGRMFAIAARRLGYRVHVLSPDRDSPTGQVADLEVTAAYEDLEAVAQFARGVSVVTYEFENVPAPTALEAARHAPLRPGGHVLEVTQQRVREKSFLRDAGIPVTPFWPVDSRADLDAALTTSGFPAVLKTAGGGYDGKGQALLRSMADVEAQWPAFEGIESILEAFIDFTCEVSVVGARGLDGTFVSYGPIQNSHANHILDISFVPAAVDARVATEAVEIARAVLEELDVVGVLCVELFVTRDGRVLVNELAPRPHNSGHLTIDAYVTCQFEQQVRAVCGLPLGAAEALRPAAMANLLGELWANGEPRWDRALELSDVKLHLYGKAAARPGRKMGHLTALGGTPEAAVARVLEARSVLPRPS